MAAIQTQYLHAYVMNEWIQSWFWTLFVARIPTFYVIKHKKYSIVGRFFHNIIVTFFFNISLLWRGIKKKKGKKVFGSRMWPSGRGLDHSALCKYPVPVGINAPVFKRIIIVGCDLCRERNASNALRSCLPLIKTYIRSAAARHIPQRQFRLKARSRATHCS